MHAVPEGAVLPSAASETPHQTNTTPPSSCTASRPQGLTAPGSSPCCFRAVLSLTISRWYATLAVAMYFCSSTRTKLKQLRHTSRAAIDTTHKTPGRCGRLVSFAPAGVPAAPLP